MYKLPKSAIYNVSDIAMDPENDKLTYRWEILPEPKQVGNGGDFEAKPKPVEGLVKAGKDGNAGLQSPAEEGAYRLFVYITDGHNKVATANIPFYVK